MQGQKNSLHGKNRTKPLDKLLFHLRIAIGSDWAAGASAGNEERRDLAVTLSQPMQHASHGSRRLSQHFLAAPQLGPLKIRKRQRNAAEVVALREN